MIYHQSMGASTTFTTSMSTLTDHPLLLNPRVNTSQTILLTLLRYTFHPTIDALTLPSLPLHIRLRLVLLQPLLLLTYTLNHIVCHLIPPLAHRPKTIYVPVRNDHFLRALVYLPHPHVFSPNDHNNTQKRKYPIHIDFHSGAFIGGHPEANARFCRHLAANEFLVVSTCYRIAPRTMFPGAVEDVRDVIRWVVGGGMADTELGMNVDFERITVSGSSAGGNLALAGCLLENGDGHGSTQEDDEREEERERTDIARKIRGIVTFYAAIDLRIPPVQKPRPPTFPRYDPLSFLLPLYDVYAASARDRGHAQSPLLSPCLARRTSIPGKVLMVVAGVDIVVREQVEFAERVNSEKENMEGEEDKGEKVELMVMEGCWHGWLEMPSIFIDEQTRTKVFEKCVQFLREVGGTPS